MANSSPRPGTYLEVKPPERVVYTWDWEKDGGEPDFGELEGAETQMTVEFRELGKKTQLVLTHEKFTSTERRDRHIVGWGMWLDPSGNLRQKPKGALRRIMSTQHKIVSRAEWLAARQELLEAEKAHTRRSDELAQKTAGVALGPHRQGVPLRHRRGHGGPRRSLPRPLAIAHLSFHVRAGLHGGLSVMLGHRGRLRRFRRAPGESRRDARRCLARAAGQAASVSATHGLELPRGRPRRAAISTTTSTPRTRWRSSSPAHSNTTSARSIFAPRWKLAKRRVSSRTSRRAPGRVGPPTVRNRPA